MRLTWILISPDVKNRNSVERMSNEKPLFFGFSTMTNGCALMQSPGCSPQIQGSGCYLRRNRIRRQDANRCQGGEKQNRRVEKQKSGGVK